MGIHIVHSLGNVTAWKTRKQGCVTKSSTHAEYVALLEVESELIYFVGLLKDCSIQDVTPVTLYEDNSAVILIVKYGNMTNNTRHIETHFHLYIRELLRLY